jgi:hypothetical protein
VTRSDTRIIETSGSFSPVGDAEAGAKGGRRHRVGALFAVHPVQAGVIGRRQCGQSDFAVRQFGELGVHATVTAEQDRAVGEGDLDLGDIARAGIR